VRLRRKEEEREKAAGQEWMDRKEEMGDSGTKESKKEREEREKRSAS
jgi:hypothetical protein